MAYKSRSCRRRRTRSRRSTRRTRRGGFNPFNYSEMYVCGDRVGDPSKQIYKGDRDMRKNYLEVNQDRDYKGKLLWCKPKDSHSDGRSAYKVKGYIPGVYK